MNQLVTAGGVSSSSADVTVKPGARWRWTSAGVVARMSHNQAVTETVLSKGQNCALPAAVQRLQLVVAWDEPAGPVAVDAGALLLTDARRVRSDEDFVFFNQPASPGGGAASCGAPER